MNKNIAIVLLSLLIGVQTVNAQAPATEAAIQKIELLGSADNVQWAQKPDGLAIAMPARLQGYIPVYVFKITMK